MSDRLQVMGVVDAVAERLRGAMFDGVLRSGSIVTEAWVAERYAVARPSAKAAIEKVVAEGLLQRTAHRSARVPELGEPAVRDVYRTRFRLEGAALRELAASGTAPEPARAANTEIERFLGGSSVDLVEHDLRFHMSIIDAIGSPRTSRAYTSLLGEVRLCMAQVQGHRLISADIIVDEHRRILELIDRGDGEAAVRLLAEHLGRAEERLVETLDGRTRSH